MYKPKGLLSDMSFFMSHPISEDRFERVFEFLSNVIRLQDVNDADVE